MRQIILDTETTGLDPQSGHRLIEIACLEMIGRKLTGQQFHVYLNPQRAVDVGAFKVHGLSNEFLRDKPLFQDVVVDFLAFVDQAELIIHNAPFDVGFINSELTRLGHNGTLTDHCDILDTLVLAKKMHPGQRNSLDALCKRYNVDNSARQLHGALLDTELLAFVYLAMTGGQTHMQFEDSMGCDVAAVIPPATVDAVSLQHGVVVFADEHENQRHQAFIEKMLSR